MQTPPKTLINLFYFLFLISKNASTLYHIKIFFISKHKKHLTDIPIVLILIIKDNYSWALIDGLFLSLIILTIVPLVYSYPYGPIQFLYGLSNTIVLDTCCKRSLSLDFNKWPCLYLNYNYSSTTLYSHLLGLIQFFCGLSTFCM